MAWQADDRRERSFRATASRSFLVALALTLWAQPLHAGLIDFDDLAVQGFPGGSLSIVVDRIAVTFTGQRLEVVQIPQFPFANTGRQLTAGYYYGPLEAHLPPGYTFDFVEIENHVNGELSIEVDVITGTAFDASGRVIDSFTNSLEKPLLSGPGIARVRFEAPVTGFSLDNFRFAVTPEPSTAVFLFLGLIALSRNRDWPDCRLPPS